MVIRVVSRCRFLTIFWFDTERREAILIASFTSRFGGISLGVSAGKISLKKAGVRRSGLFRLKSYVMIFPQLKLGVHPKRWVWKIFFRHRFDVSESILFWPIGPQRDES